RRCLGEVLVPRRQTKAIRGNHRLLLRCVVKRPRKRHAAFDVKLARFLLKEPEIPVLSFRPGNDQPDLSVAEPRQGLDKKVRSLAGDQSPEKENQAFVVRDRQLPSKRTALGKRPKVPSVNAVVSNQYSLRREAFSKQLLAFLLRRRDHSCRLSQ